jgi:hypothetical protein
MKSLTFVFFSWTFCASNLAQNPFLGTFLGTLNGDNITLVLQSPSDNRLTGKMTDSEQVYDVNGSSNGSKMTGTAVEKTYNITFQLNGNILGQHLLMDLTFEMSGQKHNMQVDFVKQGVVSDVSKVIKETPQYNKPKMPSGGKIDPNLVGKWVNEQLYNSGSGSDFMGSTSTQSLIFLADGSLSDGGSSVSMSGGNYYGNSSQNGQPTPIPNVIWYAQNQHIFILGIENGQTQTADLGKYYIENGALLITGNNGKKLLFKKR